MPSRYAQWMYDWEHRLTSVDNNRVVRPLDWGVEFTRDWPCRNGFRPGQLPAVAKEDPEKFILDYNRRIVAASDEFYSYTRPADFRLENRGGASLLHARGARPKARGEGQRDVCRIPALYLSGEDAVPRK